MLFLIGPLFGGYGLSTTIGLFFLFLACVGIAGPNASGLALAPFEENAGTASALLGFLQTGIGALATAAVGLFDSREMWPTATVLMVTSFSSLPALLWGCLGMAKRGERILTASSPNLGVH